MILKTLKDFETFEIDKVGSNQKIVYSTDLKQEAIKRYLYFTKKMDKCKVDSYWYYFKGKCDELVENFNITEADLK